MKKQEKQYLIYGGLALLGVGGYLYYERNKNGKVVNSIDNVLREVKNQKIRSGGIFPFTNDLLIEEWQKTGIELPNRDKIVEYNIKNQKEWNSVVNEFMSSSNWQPIQNYLLKLYQTTK